MASWLEIDRVRKDAAAFKDLAHGLLADPLYDRSEFADGFLADISRYPRAELTTRQGEILLQLRDEAEIHLDIRGLSVAALIEKCYLARDELDLEDVKRIEALKASGRCSVTGRQIGWFKRICKQLGEMEPYL
jgi:hypothetical protein